MQQCKPGENGLAKVNEILTTQLMDSEFFIREILQASEGEEIRYKGNLWNLLEEMRDSEFTVPKRESPSGEKELVEALEKAITLIQWQKENWNRIMNNSEYGIIAIEGINNKLPQFKEALSKYKNQKEP
jgi:hypothetical protein